MEYKQLKARLKIFQEWNGTIQFHRKLWVALLIKQRITIAIGNIKSLCITRSESIDWGLSNQYVLLINACQTPRGSKNRISLKQEQSMNINLSVGSWYHKN